MHRQSMLQTARELVSRYWSLYRDRSRSRSELAFMSSGDIELFAADCGLTPGQFSNMLKRGPHAADELLDLIKALNIDEAGVKAANRGTFNDMKLICAECRRKSECRKSLRNGTAAMDYGTFCNNAELLWEARNRSKTTA